MNITRKEVETFWRKALGNDVKERSAKKWIDAAYAKIQEWDMPLDMIAIERHNNLWMLSRRRWSSRGGYVDYSPKRKPNEQLAIKVGCHARTMQNGWNARGKWFMFPKMTPKEWFTGKGN